MINKRFNKLIIILAIIITILNCKNNREFKVDISKVKIKYKSSNFFEDIYNLKNKDLLQKDVEFREKYNELTDIFYNSILGLPMHDDSLKMISLMEFRSDSLINSILENVKLKFPNIKKYDIEFEKVLKHYKYYYPKATIPEIIYFYSNFNAKSLILDKKICVPLDFYIGYETSIVQQLPNERGFYDYIKKRMEAKNLLSENTKYFVYSMFSTQEEFLNNGIYTIRKDFLETIIFHGKMFYFLHCLIPEISDEDLFEQSTEKIDWINKNEKMIYQQVVEQNILYSSDTKVINDFVKEAPFNVGFGQEAPDMIGQWLGYKIVQSYLKNNKNKKITDLLNNNDDSRTILKYYRP